LQFVFVGNERQQKLLEVLLESQAAEVEIVLPFLIFSLYLPKVPYNFRGVSIML
jgi:hypothetical protein